MRSRRATRRWLLVFNLLLLSAALSAVGRSDQTDRRAGRHAAKPSKTKHKPASNVSATKKSSSQGSSSASDDDDDDGAGRIVGACCVGFVGALADSAANDPSDVDGDYAEPTAAAPPPAHRWGPTEPADTRGSFDVTAAKRALRQASEEAAEECDVPTEQLADRKVRVTFESDGAAAAAAFDPPFEDDPWVDCVQKTFLDAQVPPFAGEPTVVSMTLEGSEPQPD